MLGFRTADVARPENRPAEDGKQRRQEREPRREHDGDADGQGRTHALVQPELGQRHAREGGDDRESREGDRLADSSYGALDRVRTGQATAQLFANPEDKEDAVVRARAQDEDDQHELGYRGDLDPGARRLGDHRPGERQDEHRRNQSQHGRQQRSIGEDEEDEDEQQREGLGPILRRPGGLGVVNLVRDFAGEMNLHPGRRGRGCGTADGVDERLGPGDVGERHDLRLDQNLPRRAVAGDAQIHHDLDRVDAPEPRREGVDGGVVRRSEAAISDGDEGRSAEVDVDERGGHVRGLDARHGCRQESARGVLRDTAQSGQALDRHDRYQDPGDESGRSRHRSGQRSGS